MAMMRSWSSGYVFVVRSVDGVGTRVGRSIQIDLSAAVVAAGRETRWKCI